VRRGLWLLVLPLVLSLGLWEGPRAWTGRVAYRGAAPFATLTLVTPDGHQLRLSGDEAAELGRRAQGRWVTVRGQAEGKDAILVASWAWAPDQETVP